MWPPRSPGPRRARTSTMPCARWGIWMCSLVAPWIRTDGCTVDSYPAVVAERRDEAEGIVGLSLVSPDDSALPPWDPGAHLDVTLPSGLIRQFSLCGDPADRSVYRVAILLEQVSRGGSQEVHELVHPGTRLELRGPRNHFPLVDAEGYLLIAGGVGITPLLPMTREIARRARPWRMIYGGRRRDSMAFLDELRAVAGERLQIVPEDEQGRPDIDGALAARDGGTAVYCCGPEGLLRAVEESCARLGISDDLHLERFGA